MFSVKKLSNGMILISMCMFESILKGHRLMLIVNSCKRRKAERLLLLLLLLFIIIIIKGNFDNSFGNL